MTYQLLRRSRKAIYVPSKRLTSSIPTPLSYTHAYDQWNQNLYAGRFPLCG